MEKKYVHRKYRTQITIDKDNILKTLLKNEDENVEYKL